MRNPASLAILGTRGIPGEYGGFETFAERLALHLAGRGWAITVYCQSPRHARACEDSWNGVRRVFVPAGDGALASVLFDWKATLRSIRERVPVLVLGYNTAVFCVLQRLAGVTTLVNMDGIEWRRPKWSRPVRAWFWANERIAGLAAHHLIADHPGIHEHLTRHTPGARITMLPYGADAVGTADEAPLRTFGLAPRAYALLVARAEPENSMLEIVRAYSRLDRPEPLLVVGRVECEAGSAYQRAVRAAAGDRVRFAGPVYDRQVLASLRFHCGVYLHGHRVGGTNPSLVEALGAGAAVVAHDNPFNRWVAGAAGEYFRDEDELAARVPSLLAVPQKLAAMRAASRVRHAEAFQWEAVLAGYERLLDRWQRREVGALEVPPQSVRRVDP